MGCVQGKSSSESSPRNLENLKFANGYVPGGGQLRSRTVMAETVPEKEMPPLPSQSLSPLREISVGEDELVDGWPRWLVKNIPKEVLAGLVPKSADSYSKIDKVGQGTYSNVYKARDKDTGKIVALKKVRFDTAESESVKFMAREIMILQKLDHPNVLKLEGLATSRMHYSIYLVFNFMQSDLTKIISRPGQRLTEPQIKCYMHQLLSGLQHCHERGILHRDIKGSNLLIDADGVLKIGDFGLANHFNLNPKRPLTNRVVTLWYRAPELLLGSTDYGVGIDLWSAGCLLAEMFFGRPVLPGRTEVEQLHRIFKLCGSPSGDYWRKLKISANFRPPQPYKPNFLETFKDLPLSSQNLLINLLALDPHNRGTAASGLQSEFFSTEPLACHISDLPVPPNREWNETNLSQDRKKHASFVTTNLHAQEEDHDQRMQNQTMLSNQMEKAGLMGYHQQQEDASGPNPYNAPDMILLSPPSSLGTEPYNAPSEPKSDPSATTQRYAFEKLPSSSSLCRCSEKDQTPNFSMEMRSSSTSEYFSFSANWAVNFNTTVD